MKLDWKPGTMIYPLPAVLVSCGDSPENYNMLTVSWVGTTCTNPAMCYISVRPERHSYPIIKESGEFVINLTTAEMAHATDWCGVRSGADYDGYLCGESDVHHPTSATHDEMPQEGTHAPSRRSLPLCFQ